LVVQGDKETANRLGQKIKNLLTKYLDLIFAQTISQAATNT
jgi:hypothetical protein